VEEKFQHQSLDFQKAKDADLKLQRLTRSHQRTEKTRSTVKNSIRLGYILYEATTYRRVTFSYELTGIAFLSELCAAAFLSGIIRAGLQPGCA
jgi:hypothetical protein